MLGVRASIDSIDTTAPHTATSDGYTAICLCSLLTNTSGNTNSKSVLSSKSSGTGRFAFYGGKLGGTARGS